MNRVPLPQLNEQLLQSVADRVARRGDELAACSETTGALTRTFCSNAMKDAHDQVRTWMEASSMRCRLDPFGNFVGYLQTAAGKTDQAEVFMLGSHLDTVINAGRFDGALGVLLGLGVAELIHESNIELPFDLEVIGFSEEEGVRFGFPFIGSLGISGKLNLGELDRTDANGVSIREALVSFGCPVDPVAESGDTEIKLKRLVGFMETHIEQATLLESANIPVGIVSGIAGQTRAAIVIEGVSDHAGTTPHKDRCDALAGAAKLILDIETLGHEIEGLFATVGSAKTSPGLSNVICGQVELLLDLRHQHDEVRLKSLRTIELMLLELKATRGLAARMYRVDHSPAVPMNATLMKHLSDSVTAAIGSAQMLVSGAGHDAMVMAPFTPSCMLFLRCRDGVSHHPDEFVSPQDIRVALEIMTQTVIRVANSPSDQKTA